MIETTAKLAALVLVGVGTATAHADPPEARIRVWSIAGERWEPLDTPVAGGTITAPRGSILFTSVESRELQVANGESAPRVSVNPTLTAVLPLPDGGSITPLLNKQRRVFYGLRHPRNGLRILAGSDWEVRFRFVERPRILNVSNSPDGRPESTLTTTIVRTPEFHVVVDDIPDAKNGDLWFFMNDEPVKVESVERVGPGQWRCHLCPKLERGRYRLSVRYEIAGRRPSMSNPLEISYEPRLAAISLATHTTEEDEDGGLNGGEVNVGTDREEEKKEDDTDTSNESAPPSGDAGPSEPPKQDDTEMDSPELQMACALVRALEEGRLGNDRKSEARDAVQAWISRFDFQKSDSGEEAKKVETAEDICGLLRKIADGKGTEEDVGNVRTWLQRKSGRDHGSSSNDERDDAAALPSRVTPFPSHCSDGSCDPEFDPPPKVPDPRANKVQAKFAFREAAHFPLVTWEHRDSKAVGEGAVVDGMTLSIKRDGSYEVKYRVFTPVKVRIRMDLLVRECSSPANESCKDGSCLTFEPDRWHVIPMPYKTVEASPGKPCEVCVYGHSAFLHKLYSGGGEHRLELRRRGSAEFGTVPEVALTR